MNYEVIEMTKGCYDIYSVSGKSKILIATHAYQKSEGEFYDNVGNHFNLKGGGFTIDPLFDSLLIKDAINPSHYKAGKIEAIDAIEAATVNKTGIEAVCTANVIKYLWRYEAKNGLEDVKKAKWYLEKLLSFLESKVK